MYSLLLLPCNNRNYIRHALSSFATGDESTLEIEADVDPPGADPEMMALVPFTVPVPLAPVEAGLGTKVVYPHANTNGHVRVRANIRWDTHGRETASVGDHEAIIKAEA